MYFTTKALLCSGALFVGMLVCLEFGRRVGIRKLAADPEWALAGLGVVETAVFGLYGLLVAFTFSGAPARLDIRKHLIADEASAIGTAYLRLDLLPEQSQPAMRDLFRKYLSSRLDLYDSSGDLDLIKNGLAKCRALQKDIWTEAVARTRLPGSHKDAAELLLPALNEMFDIAAKRTSVDLIHPPAIVYGLMFAMALVCSSLAGYSMAREKQRSWLHIMAFAMVTAVSVYTFLEIEYPRLGSVRLLGTSAQSLFELSERMQ